MKYELVITADTNDADYVSQTTVITDIETFLKNFGELIEDIKKNQGTWENSEYAHEDPPEVMYDRFEVDTIEHFADYLPYGEYGIHTIESIVYYPLPEKIKLL